MTSGDSTAEMLTCPVCGTRYRIGELACPGCGTVFSKGGRTRQMTDDEKDIAGFEARARSGLDKSQAAVSFLIGGRTLMLPMGEFITIGRASSLDGDTEPDVDLGPYGADEKGVSRHHLRIHYRGYQTYALDLNSSNGTWLNGQKLPSHTEYLLHDGDELRLGRLKLNVKF